MKKLRQFEFLTLAIKISFLFDFCVDVLLIMNYVIMSTSLSFTVGGCKAKNRSILCYCENIHVLFVADVQIGLF